MRPLAILLLVASASSCQPLTEPEPFAALDRAYFDCKVQPLLTKTCAGFACHGDPARYFTIFTRNRLRFGGTEDERNAELRAIERDFNYTAAAAQVDADDPAASLLLLKPLEQNAGGYFHRGAEIFGKGDVFASLDDRELTLLSEWAHGAAADPMCLEAP